MRTGETGRMGAPKRREVGHGRLAKRALGESRPDVQAEGDEFRAARDRSLAAAK